LRLVHTEGKPDTAVAPLIDSDIDGNAVLLASLASGAALPRTVLSRDLPIGGYCLFFAALDITDNRFLVPYLSGERATNDVPIRFRYEFEERGN